MRLTLFGQLHMLCNSEFDTSAGLDVSIGKTTYDAGGAFDGVLLLLPPPPRFMSEAKYSSNLSV